jgi:ubiquinone/menaquinone biosynthesis C-methylase UbiE
MSTQSPSAIELEFARRYDQEHARACRQPRSRGLGRRLTFWRDEQLLRNALKVAGEPGLILDVACGAGRFWPVLAEHANRVILASDPSQDMLDHAQTHHPQNLLERITTFQSSAFTLGLSANAVDCIVCMQMFQYIDSAEHRLAMLKEFHRVSRDTVIVAVRVDAHFKLQRPVAEAAQPRQLPGKAEVEAQFREAGLRLLSHQDFLPGCARMRVYVLRKTR